MKRALVISCLAIALSMPAFAEKAATETKAPVKTTKAAKEVKEAVKPEAVEKTGTIEVKKAEKGEKHDAILLKVDAETFKLIPSKGLKDFAGLAKLAGKEVTVKGELLAADTKHPLAAIKVESFAEKGAPVVPAPVK